MRSGEELREDMEMRRKESCGTLTEREQRLEGVDEEVGRHRQDRLRQVGEHRLQRDRTRVSLQLQ